MKPGLIRAFGAGLTVVGLTACKAVVLEPSGDIAARQRDLLVDATWLMLLVIIPVMIMTIWFAWTYRASNTEAEYHPDWDHSTKFELGIWAIPLLIIICIGAMTWVGTHKLDPYRPLDQLSAQQPLPADTQPIRVQVVSLDWKWLFIYPDYGVATLNELAVPANREIAFDLTSQSVMNAFYIPAMAGMIYTMPGMETRLHGVLNREGVYKGLSSHYSGAGFAGMHFLTHATDEAAFEDWIARARAGGGDLTRDAYMQLAAPSENEEPRTWGHVDPELFDRVVNLCVPEDKMCAAEMMAIDARGGMGLEGAVNIQHLTHERNAAIVPVTPVLGRAPFMVTSICTPEEAALMFARTGGASRAQRRTDQTPMTGHALPVPTGLFERLTGLAAQESRRQASADQ
ncbi:ubiquinol oxidase subunit II [Paracoccus sp. (in: a-proteobacteria)]|uniref:ubiquinol oxidase subunit II n=1 Tax=Paracoccus sp. TaxID=267 RepID=UPI003A852E99